MNECMPKQINVQVNVCAIECMCKWIYKQMNECGKIKIRNEWKWELIN